MIEDADAADAEIGGQVRNDLGRFLEVGGAHIDDIRRFAADAQELRAREGCDIGHAGLRGNGLCRSGGGCADCAHQPEHAVLLNKAPGVGEGRLGFVGVVERAQGNASAMHSAGPVGFLECGQQPKAHALPQGAGRAAQCRGLAKQILRRRIGNWYLRAGFRCRNGAGKRKQHRANQQRDARTCIKQNPQPGCALGYGVPTDD